MRKYIILAVFVFCVFSVTLTSSVRTTLSEGLTGFSTVLLVGNGSTAYGNTDARNQNFSDTGGVESMTESSYRSNGGIYAMEFQFLLDGSSGNIYNGQDIKKFYSASENRVPFVKFKNIVEADSALPSAGGEGKRSSITQAAVGASGTLYEGTAATSTSTNGPVALVGFAFEGFGSAAAAGKAYQFTYEGDDPHGGFINPAAWNSSNVNLAETSYVDFKHSIIGGPTDFTGMDVSAGLGPQ
jgi:hypothetical protein